MKRRYAIFGLLLALLAASCEKVVEFDVGDVTPYVVVTGRPQADSAVTVRLSYSRFFLDGHSFNTIDGATLQLMHNGNAVLPTPRGSGFYDFACAPQPGDTLTLHVEVDGYDPIVAGTRFPQRPNIEIVEFLLDTTDYYDVYGKLKMKLIDPQGENYYKLSVSGYRMSYDPEIGGSVMTLSDLFISTDDVVFTDATSLDYILDEGETSVSDKELRFSDVLFDGQDHTFTLNFSMWKDDEYYDFENMPFFVKVRGLSRDLYRYECTLTASDDDLALLTEPTQVYCNIQGGIGIFAASTLIKQKLYPTYQVFQHDNGYYYKKQAPKKK